MSKLIAPCSYQGGKQRLAKQIVDIIYQQNDITEDTRFYDLCCGSGSISIEMVNRGFYDSNITMVDASPWGEFYKGVGDLTFSPDVFKLYIDDIPKDITKIKDYAKEVLKRPANEGMFCNMVYKFLILQACAFGSSATWVKNNEWKKAGGLRDYWLPTETSNRKSPVNPMMPMPNTLFERVENICANMDNVVGICDDVMNIEIEENSIVYLDPPYKNTQDYGYSLDYDKLIYKIKNIKGVKLYVSEGYKMEGAKEHILLSKGRSKGNINAKINKKPTEEWLNIFT